MAPKVVVVGSRQVIRQLRTRDAPSSIVKHGGIILDLTYQVRGIVSRYPSWHAMRELGHDLRMSHLGYRHSSYFS
jgi:hypothetical protein